MTQILLSTAWTAFPRGPQDPPKDGAEEFADVCLYLPRIAFGAAYNLQMQEIPTDTIMRVALAIICVIGFIITAPLALIGLCAADCSGTYNTLLAQRHLSLNLAMTKEKTLREIFRHAASWLPADMFAQQIVSNVYKRNQALSHTMGQCLMLELLNRPTYVSALAQASGEKLAEPNTPDGHLAAYQLILHCQTPQQFHAFVQPILESHEKMNSCIEMMLNFFYDDRLDADDKQFFALRFCLLKDLLGEEALAKYIFDGNGLHKDHLDQQVIALCNIFPDSLISARATSLVEDNS